MAESIEHVDALRAHAARRTGRRAFFQTTVAAAVGAGFILASAAEAQTIGDPDILNFALNLEYLEANFYYYSVYGTPIPSTSITPGSASTTTAFAAVPTTGASGVVYNAGARAVPFKDPIIAQIAAEIANDEYNHVVFLRQALMSAAVAQPMLDIGIDPNGSFSTLARLAGLIGATTTAAPTFFDPYASDLNFLLGAFVFEDVGVTAYKGASPLISNPAYLDAAAGILATEAYHAAIVRTSLDQLAIATPTIRANTEAISNVRDSVDGTSDDDQGIAQTTGPVGAQSNIVPTDSNGIAFSRTAANVLNVVYGTAKSVSMGGFFPAGVNGTIKASAANA